MIGFFIWYLLLFLFEKVILIVYILIDFIGKVCYYYIYKFGFLKVLGYNNLFIYLFNKMLKVDYFLGIIFKIEWMFFKC